MNRRTTILIAMLIVVFGVAGANWLLAISGPDNVEGVIRAMNFRPQRPPNTLHGPGSLYLVNAFGKVKSRVCDIGDIKPKWQEGPTEERIIQAFSTTEGQVQIGPEGSTSEGTSAATFYLVLHAPKIRLVDLEELSSINQKLQERPRCAIAIQKELDAGRCVTQSQSVLVATLNFNSHINGAISVDLETQVMNSAMDAELARIEHRLGKSLYYGFQLMDRCMTRSDQKYPRYVPDETWWFVKTVANVFYTFLEKVGV